MFVKPVDGHDDLFAFNYGFALEGKAAEDTVVTELDDGDLLISGWAATFDGVDREGENFEPGAFQRGIKSFLNGQAALCYHHKHDQGIGKVLKLEEVEGKGLYMEARVDKQEPSSPLHYIYNGIKKGTYNGLSCGGFFKRRMTERGPRIANMDFTEISVTPVPVHPGTNFAVIAGKALEQEVEEDQPEAPLEQLERLTASLQTFVEREEGKALPKNYNPTVASTVSDFLAGTAQLRSLSTSIKSLQDIDDFSNEELESLADEVESSCVGWEAQAHKLAAKVGPLPPQSSF